MPRTAWPLASILQSAQTSLSTLLRTRQALIADAVNSLLECTDRNTRGLQDEEFAQELRRQEARDACEMLTPSLRVEVEVEARTSWRVCLELLASCNCARVANRS